MLTWAAERETGARLRSSLLRRPSRLYDPIMTERAPLIEDDEVQAEASALAAALAVAEADPRRVPHEQVRTWLLRLAAGDFSARQPLAR
jgi:hypothetical protein